MQNSNSATAVSNSASSVWGANLEMVVNAGSEYLFYPFNSQKRWIDKNMFTALAGQPGCPPLCQVVNNSTSSPTVLTKFAHIFVDLTTATISIKTADLLAGQAFEQMVWNIEAINLLGHSMEQLYAETANRWLEYHINRGYRIIFSVDIEMGNQLNRMKNVAPTQMPSQRRRLLEALNFNYRTADTLPVESLKEIVMQADLDYNNTIDEPEVTLKDNVYEYVRDLYRVKMAENGIMDTGLWSTTGRDNGMGHVPPPVGRMLELPTWLGSQSKMKHDDGQLALFLAGFAGPYVVSAKMDGASALLFRKDGRVKLYSRGRDGMAQDVSEVLNYLKVPDLEEGYMIRGELIIRNSVFNAKHLRKDPKEKGKYSNPRNAVGGGLVNKLGCRAAGSKSSTDPLDIPFIDDVRFVVYESITTPMVKCSDQMKYLASWVAKRPDTHVEVVSYVVLDTVSDDLLSNMYDKCINTLDYEIDGLIICSDQVYERPSDSNPKYSRAYKKPLACLTAITKIISVEWNVKNHGYLFPTLIIEPFWVSGAKIERATGNNASWVRDNKWGPGAIIEVTRSGNVIPKVIRTLEPAAQPQPPTQPCVWDANQVHLILNDTDPNSEANQQVVIQRLVHFVEKIKVDGLGEGNVVKLYKLGVTSPVHFFMLRPEHVLSIGQVQGPKLVKAIQDRVGKISLPMMAGASGCFGRSIGRKLMTIIFSTYPDILESYAVQNSNIEQLKAGLAGIPNFGPERSAIVAAGFPKFVAFLKELQNIGYPVVWKHQLDAPKTIAQQHPLTGIKITMTGFHKDPIIIPFLDRIGALVQDMKADTQLLIIKDDSYRNTKTEKAEAKGVTIISRADFIQRYATPK